MRRTFCLVLLGLLAAALLLPAAARALTFDQAIDKLIADGYPQRVEAQLNSYGTSPLGMRMGGTSANNAAARYIADEMKRLGMVNVCLERVPVDQWEWYGASVTVNGRELTATSFGGVPGTPPAGLTGDLVYVGLGSSQEFDAAGEVSGKIVLCDFASDYWWMNLPGLEAKLRGAKAVVMTYNPRYPYYYSIAPDALGTNDGCYDWDACPMVYVCQNDGDWLKWLLDDGDATATVVNSLSMKFADQGGFGYNVYGEVAGSAKSAEKVVYGSHHDAYFRMGLDDTSGVVANLMMVKAMKMAGYTPSRTIGLLETTSEEWGYTNAYYDWLAGAYQAIKSTHPDWPGKVVCFVENELLGYKDGALWMTATPELTPWLSRTVAANRKLVGPTGGQVYAPDESVWFTYNDQWPMTARGIPSVCLWTPPDGFWTSIYHTDYETVDLVDWTKLGDQTKFIWRLALTLDKGLLPYELSARARHLAGTVDGAALTAAGCDQAPVDRFTTAVADFGRAAAAYDARRASLPSRRIPAVNDGLKGVTVDLNKALTGLGCWDETFYPHQQTLVDLQYLNKAIGQLEQPNPVAGNVLTSLSWIGATWYGMYFSEPVWERELERREPDYPRLNWAEYGHIPLFIDVMPQYRQVEAGEFAAARAGLLATRAVEVADLEARLEAMSATLESVTPRIDALR
jgi:hypothetical protein